MLNLYYLVIEFHFLKIFLCINQLRYPLVSFNIYLGHVIQKYKENLLKLKYWGWKAVSVLKVNLCSEGAKSWCTPGFRKIFMEVLKDYYDMAMPTLSVHVAWQRESRPFVTEMSHKFQSAKVQIIGSNWQRPEQKQLRSQRPHLTGLYSYLTFQKEPQSETSFLSANHARNLIIRP